MQRTQEQKDEHNADKRRRYHANHAENLARGRAYRKANQERIKKQDKERYLANRGVVLARQKIYQANNKLRIKEYDRQRNLRSKYGLTIDQYNAMILAQRGCCAICLKKVHKICVDHNHKTNKVRGLLCGNCNTALGLLYESKTIASNLLNYLELW